MTPLWCRNNISATLVTIRLRKLTKKLPLAVSSNDVLSRKPHLRSLLTKLTGKLSLMYPLTHQHLLGHLNAYKVLVSRERTLVFCYIQILQRKKTHTMPCVYSVHLHDDHKVSVLMDIFLCIFVTTTFHGKHLQSNINPTKKVAIH